MITSRFTLLKRLFAILTITGILLVPATSAFANVRVEGGNVPFYARLNSGEIYNDDGLVAIVFYRPPSCIRPDFNLLDFFDIPGAFDCTPQTTQGFEIWENGPGIDPAPKLSEVKGLGAVPVWFVSLPALQTSIADGVLTIGELSSLDPLIGSASFFHETLRPTGTVKVSTGEINANGKLSDGRSFKLHIITVDYPSFHITTKIMFN